MRKTRNQLRLERKRAEAERPGTIQYIQAHREPRRRQWMRTLAPEVFKKVWAAVLAGRRVRMKRIREEEPTA